MTFYSIEQFEFYMKVEMMRLFRYISNEYDCVNIMNKEKQIKIDYNTFCETIMRELKITILNDDEIDTIVEYLRLRFNFSKDIYEQFRGMMKIKIMNCDITNPIDPGTISVLY